jgi:hypothetical protein
MNLLRIQDALKDASDQQLVQMMQAPDSTAPSYLVLSELRRRKEMRTKQAPQEGPNRTVAEELTAPEAPVGIRSIQPPQMDPDGVDAADGGVQGMAAGGIVRMQEGGTPPDEEEEIPFPPPDAPPVPRSREPAGIGALAPQGGVERAPTISEIFERNRGLFPDTMAPLRERMQQDRVDPAARRGEALNMALIEAGLRIAGSRNPSLAGAIGEGATPAVQSYGQQLGQIRTEQRQALRDEAELAKQEVNRQFAIGRISAAEHRNLIAEIGANARAAAAERAASIRAGAAETAADRRAQAEADRVAAATERALEIENIRDRRARELATQQHEERELREISQGVQRAMTDLGTVSSTRTMLRAERLRQNPNERNPQISDDDVRNYMLDQAIRTRQEALRRARAGSMLQETSATSGAGGTRASGNDPLGIR